MSDNTKPRSETLKLLFQADDINLGVNRRKVILATGVVWIAIHLFVIAIRSLTMGVEHVSPWSPFSILITTAVVLGIRKGLAEMPAALIMITNVFVTLVYFCYISSGFKGPVVYLVPVVPVMAFLLVNRRFGWVMTVATILVMVTYCYLNLSGHEFRVGPPPGRNIFVARAVSVILLVLVLAWISWYYTRVYDNFYRSVRSKNQELVRVAQYKSDFLSSMSHEFRTPLNAILGFSSSLSRRLQGNIDDRYLGSILSIKRNGDHLLSLVNDILDVAKLEEGKVNLHLQAVDLIPLIDQCANDLRILAQDKNLSLEIENTYFDKALVVHGDIGRLRQILMNLTSNAIKYTNSGGIRIAFEKLYDADLGLSAKVSVIDTGVGIAPTELDKIFSKFERADMHDQGKILGSGLGLVIVSELVALHAGKIEVKSELDKGSTFAVYVPLLSRSTDIELQGDQG